VAIWLLSVPALVYGDDLHTNDKEEKEMAAAQGTGTSDTWDATQWHEVKKGETLSKIAEKYYGDSGLYPKIFEANRDILKDPKLIKVGQKLRIP
jgi:nucleoid-associated protein YgaU